MMQAVYLLQLSVERIYWVRVHLQTRWVIIIMERVSHAINFKVQILKELLT